MYEYKAMPFRLGLFIMGQNQRNLFDFYDNMHSVSRKNYAVDMYSITLKANYSRYFVKIKKSWSCKLIADPIPN